MHPSQWSKMTTRIELLLPWLTIGNAILHEKCIIWSIIPEDKEDSKLQTTDDMVL